MRRFIEIAESLSSDPIMVELQKLLDHLNQHLDQYTRPYQVFWLPTKVLQFHDDPYKGLGDELFSVEDLISDVRQNGVINPLIVGKSIYEMLKGDNTPVVFNGNHRLAAAKQVGQLFVPCECVDVEETYDSWVLSIDEIISLGGSLTKPA